MRVHFVSILLTFGASSVPAIADGLPNASGVGSETARSDRACCDCDHSHQPCTQHPADRPRTGRLDWPGLRALADVVCACWYEASDAIVGVDRPYGVALFTAQSRSTLIRQLADLVPLIDPLALSRRPDEQVIELGKAIVGIEEIERSVGLGRGGDLNAPWYGCQVIESIVDVNLVSPDDRNRFANSVYSPPRVNRAPDRLEVTILCSFPDLGGSLRKEIVEIHRDAAPVVRTEKTGFAIRDGRLEEESGMFLGR